ncbi:GNAT family N-acetyltransferase [Rhizobium sp. S95]|uniref:GNAT family N-acetyltransferase n=1 Tax=Ciceribacter sichuanensis TaxID=2949647 RepID=A0AAJ1FHL5_9HYPH|nr:MULTISPECIES: GNAT family N-acetyltransferase [unclassified Ciceribacter]MCM2396127.1 GNAT family N-acetyltransferase [Ciceribacter sp. S95]MCO5956091.1 GNAT family N-acetyltransferase [Ciceribacter sp. S101]
MSEVVICRFTEGDVQGVIDVILPIQREEFEIPISAADQPDLSDIPGFYQVGSGDFWVAKIDGVIVGTIGLKDIGEGQAALRKMFVAEAWRGREFGVATALLQGLLAEAKGRGFGEVYLGTTAKFLAAHRFYEKNGFLEIGENALPERFPRMAVDTKFYRIALA